MDKQGIMDYVMETPTNTNPRILGQMLDEYGEGSGGSGGSGFIIHGTPGGSEQEPTISIDKTFDEIVAAFSEGYIPVLDVAFGPAHPAHNVYYLNTITNRGVDFVYYTRFITGTTSVDVSTSKIVINPQNEIDISNQSFKISRTLQ